MPETYSRGRLTNPCAKILGVSGDVQADRKLTLDVVEFAYGSKQETSSLSPVCIWMFYDVQKRQ